MNSVSVTPLQNNLNNYVCEMPLPPAVNPPHLPPLSGEVFDPARHLQLEPPQSIKDLCFRDVVFPFQGGEQSVKRNLAYTRPFRVLSDEGVAAARRALDQHEPVLGKGNARAPRFVRGLGYVSHWHRGLAYSPQLLTMLNQLSRDAVAPQTMTMNISHTNVGRAGTGKAVDKWHVDSVDYVLIIILSDLTDMKGGELRVLQVGPDGQLSELS